MNEQKRIKLAIFLVFYSLWGLGFFYLANHQTLESMKSMYYFVGIIPFIAYAIRAGIKAKLTTHNENQS